MHNHQRESMSSAQLMMAHVRLRSGDLPSNASGWKSDGTLADRPCLCPTCKATQLRRFKLRPEQEEGDVVLQELAGRYDKKCQMHALQAKYH